MELQAGAKLLLLLVIYCGDAQSIRIEARYASIIDVTNGGTWGDWAWPEMCPDGYFASGFSIKVEPPQGIPGDDTALNGIRLHLAFSLRVEPFSFPGDNTAVNNVRFRCSDGVELEGPGLSWGDYGDWSNSCAKGVCGLQTKIQKPRGPRDDTALND
ncbi:hypothetical protein A6R68_09094, partial [Neotoma lepida]